MPSRKLILGCLSLILICIVFIYFPGLHNEFRIDDESYASIKSQEQFNSWLSYFTFNSLVDDQHYNPINYLLNISLFRHLPQAPWIFHLVNLFIYAAHCYLLYIFVHLITNNNPLAVLTTILFLIHPINTDIVGQISLNVIMLCAIFMQLSLITFWHYLKTPKNKYLIFMSLVCGGLGLLSHETGLLLPGYIMILLLCIKRYALKETMIKSLPYIILVASFLVIWTSFTGSKAGIASKFISLFSSVPQYLASMMVLIFWYLRNLIQCDQISFLYNTFPIKENLLAWNLLLLTVLINISLYFYITIKKNDNFKTFGICYFLCGLIILVPASVGHAEMGYVIEPNWFYFSTAGFVFIISDILLKFSQSPYRKLGLVILVSVLLFYIHTSKQLIRVGRTAQEYYEHWLTVSPNNYLALLGMSDVHAKKQNYTQVLYYSDLARKATTGNTYQSLYNIGSVWGIYRQFDLAEKYLNQASKLAPQSPEPHYQLAKIYLQNNKIPQAQTALHQALQHDATFIPARLKLTQIYLNENQPEQAIKTLEYAINSPLETPQRNEAIVNLIAIDFKIKRNDMGEEHIRQVLSTTQNLQGLMNISLSLQELEGADQAALMMINYSIQKHPSSALLFLTKGVILANTGQLKEAIQVWQQGAQLNPSEKQFTTNINQAKKILDYREKQIHK